MKQEIERLIAVITENNKAMEMERKKAIFEAHVNELNQTLSKLQKELFSKTAQRLLSFFNFKKTS